MPRDDTRGLRVPGQLPLGYVAGPAPRQLVVAPEEAEIVRRMFADAAEGAFSAAIAARARERGRHPTPAPDADQEAAQDKRITAHSTSRRGVGGRLRRPSIVPLTRSKTSRETIAAWTA